MELFEFLLQDRVAKIKAINEQYDLEKNAYISFSGGKDSCIVSELIDIALPNNRIPRLHINTGVEYRFITEYVKERAKKDNRFIIINSEVNIKKMLEADGYPFESKQHSHNWIIYKNNVAAVYLFTESGCCFIQMLVRLIYFLNVIALV